MPDNYDERNALAGLHGKLDRLMKDFHQLEIHLAEIKAVQTGKVEKMEYRIEELESKQEAMTRHIISLAMAFLVAVIGGIVSFFFQAVMK